MSFLKKSIFISCFYQYIVQYRAKYISALEENRTKFFFFVLKQGILCPHLSQRARLEEIERVPLLEANMTDSTEASTRKPVFIFNGERGYRISSLRVFRFSGSSSQFIHKSMDLATKVAATLVLIRRHCFLGLIQKPIGSPVQRVSPLASSKILQRFYLLLELWRY